MDEELRGQLTNRVFDLDDDGSITGEDRRILGPITRGTLRSFAAGSDRFGGARRLC